ncbi:MAG: prepilin-type N-terminal cleavage/methylation domain-containing protein [Planctomycetota bacterium]|jgi:prepilin-type N-terminal cleavage/methylation domain-containing protein
MRFDSLADRRKSGFTLVEVAVSLVIIGIGLTLCLQALQTAKMQAAQTRNFKLARELAVMTLGQIESGLFSEEITSGYSESYAQEGYPEFNFEILLGDEEFEDESYDDHGDYHDAFEARRQRRLDEADEADQDEDEIEEAYEMVKIRVTFPKFQIYRNNLVMESWMVWDQVYGPDEDQEESGGPSPPGP